MKKTAQYLTGKFNELLPVVILVICLTICSSAAMAQVPNGPTDFRTTQVGYTLELDWTDNAENETRFVIQKEWIDEFSNNIQIALPANTVHYVDAEVQPNIQYYYTIWAENEFGPSTEENASGIVSADVPPTPTNVSAVAGPLMSIEVTFTDNSDLETYYEIHHTDNPDEYYGLEKVTGSVLNSLITHYISDGPYNPYSQPPPDEVYYHHNTLVYIKVRAVNDNAGRLIYGPFSPVVTTINPGPVPPTDFVATPEGNDVHLTWTDNSINEAAYFLVKFEEEFSYDLPVIQLPANATEYTHYNVQSNIEYHYWLIAIDVFEYTVWPPRFWPELFTQDESRVAKTSVTILELPPAPSDLAGTVISPTSILLTFTDNSDLEGFYHGQVCLSANDSSVIGDLEGFGSGIGTSVRIEVEYLTPGITYFFRMRGVLDWPNFGLTGPYCEFISVSIPNLVLDAPVAEPATPVTTKSFWASWGSVAYADYYELDVFDSKDGTYVPGYEGAVIYGTYVMVITKKPIHHYSYRVRAVSDNTEKSEYSNIIAVGKTKNASIARDETLDEYAVSGISIYQYPNPVIDKFQLLISAPDEGIAEVQIMNYYGTRIYTQRIRTNEITEVDATSYPPGMYVLKAVIGRNARMVKVIKME